MHVRAGANTQRPHTVFRAKGFAAAAVANDEEQEEEAEQKQVDSEQNGCDPHERAVAAEIADADSNATFT